MLDAVFDWGRGEGRGMGGEGICVKGEKTRRGETLRETYGDELYANELSNFINVIVTRTDADAIGKVARLIVERYAQKESHRIT